MSVTTTLQYKAVYNQVIRSVCLYVDAKRLIIRYTPTPTLITIIVIYGFYTIYCFFIDKVSKLGKMSKRRKVDFASPGKLHTLV